MERQIEILEKVYHLDYLVKDCFLEELAVYVANCSINECNKIVSANNTNIENKWIEIICYIKATNDNRVIEEIKNTQYLRDRDYLDGMKEVISMQTRQICIPQEILIKLQNTKSNYNDRHFIEDATVWPLEWLQNKQIARELLTHDKIKGVLTEKEIIAEASKLFIYKGNPLKLSKNKPNPSQDSDLLNEIINNYYNKKAAI